MQDKEILNYIGCVKYIPSQQHDQKMFKLCQQHAHSGTRFRTGFSVILSVGDTGKPRMIWWELGAGFRVVFLLQQG